MVKQVDQAVQDYYSDEIAWCYGCGRLNEKGHHFRTGWLEGTDKTVSYYFPLPEHTAVPGFVYGGLIASFVDCHSTGSASLALHRKKGFELGEGEVPRFVTASLHVDYIKPTPQGVQLKAVGEVDEIHPKKWKIVTEVYAGETLCAKGEVIAVVMPDSFLKK